MSRPILTRQLIDLSCLALAAAALAGCHPGNGPSAAAPAATAASAPAVGVTTVPARQTDLPVTLTATGTVTPLSSVDVRPQVNSVVSAVHIHEGQFVKAGELLFTLDARADEANVAKAQAQVARDQATLADAQRQLARSRDLLSQNFISQGQVDANQAAVDAATALVAADRAALAAARVALGYARITAPGAGRVGTIAVYPGSAVKANDTTLVTITQLDPIAVAMGLPQRHLGDALAALPGGGAEVSATLPNGGGTLAGRLKFVDNLVDATSGTVKVKAVFPNPGGKLWPGAFVNVSMTARTLKNAVVVPQASIIQSARGDIVYVVQDKQAAARPVQVVYADGDIAAVTGVRAGDHVVLDGRQNLRPGSAVAERAAVPERAAAASGAASAADNRASAP
jgi:RND family efflux transporter MFP subunit